jgi:hypothetical protein
MDALVEMGGLRRLCNIAPVKQEDKKENNGPAVEVVSDGLAIHVGAKQLMDRLRKFQFASLMN